MGTQPLEAMERQTLLPSLVWIYLVLRFGVPYTDFKDCISQYILSTWQDDWKGAVANTLHSVKTVLGDWQTSYRRCRKDEVVLCCVRIGDTHLTHSYILKKDAPPQCEHC